MTGPVFEAIGAYRQGVDKKLINNQNFGINTQAKTTVNPGWASRYLVGDSTYAAVLNAEWAIFGNTGSATAGTAHTHPLEGSGAGIMGSAMWSNAALQANGGYITCTDTYQVDLIEFWAYTTTAMAGGTIDVELFRELPDRSLTRIAIWSQATMPTTATLMQIPLTNTLITRIGERYLLRLVNRSSPLRTLVYLAMDGFTNAGVPSISHVTSGATNTNKTSYTQAEADTYEAAGQLVVFFTMARTALPPEDKTFIDEFDRVNLGPQWAGGGTGSDGSPVITNSRLAFDTTVTFTDPGFQPAFCIYPTSTDAMRVDADVWNLATAYGVALVISLDRDRQNMTLLRLTATSAKIQTTLAGGALTDRASVTITADDAAWSIYYEPTPKKYTVLRNNIDIGLTWTDSGALVPHGANNRYGGIFIYRNGGVSGGDVDNFVLRDWKP